MSEIDSSTGTKADTKRKRRERLPSDAVHTLMEIISAAEHAQADYLEPASDRAGRYFDETSLLYLRGLAAKLAKIKTVAQRTLRGESLTDDEDAAEVERQAGVDDGAGKE